MAAPGALQLDRWKPDESAASALLRGDKVILYGSCITTIGNFACEPCRVLAATAGDEELGRTLMEVLAAAKIAAPPADWKAEQKKIFAAAGFKSWAKMEDGALDCHVGMTPQQLTIIPTRKDGRAFMHLPDKAVKVPVWSLPEQIGKALRDGFSRCK